MKGERKCPVCDTPVAEEALECPSCGLPKELWPDQVDLGTPTVPTPAATVAATPPPAELAPAPTLPEKEEPAPSPPAVAPTPSPTPPVEETAPSPPPETPQPSPPSPPVEVPKEQSAPSPPVEEAPESPPPSPPQEEPKEPLPPETPSPVVEPPSTPIPVQPEPTPSPPVQKEEVPVPTRPAEPVVVPVEVTPPPTSPSIEVVKKDPDLAFAKLAQVNKRLVELAVRYSVDVRSAAQMLKRAANFWKISEKSEAIAEMRSAEAELGNALLSKGAGLLAESTRDVDNMGPFASAKMREALEQMAARHAARDLEGYFRNFEALETETAEQERQLANFGPMINTLNQLENGIVSLGNSSFRVRPSIEKAYGYVEKGHRKEGEAMLAMAVTQAIEILQPLLERRIVEISNRLKMAHTRGIDVRAPAVLVKQITIALRARRFTQVLQLLSRVETIFPDSLTNGDSEKAHEREAARTRVRTRSTVTSDSEKGTSHPAAGAAPVEMRAGRTYLFMDSRPTRGIEAFRQVKGDRHGLLMTSTFPPKLMEDYGVTGKNVVWISENAGWTETYNPRLMDHEVTARALHFMEEPEAAVVMIDGLGELISANGLERTVKFLKKILDAAASKRIVVITTLLPGSTDAAGKSRIEGMFDEVAG